MIRWAAARGAQEKRHGPLHRPDRDDRGGVRRHCRAEHVRRHRHAEVFRSDDSRLLRFRAAIARHSYFLGHRQTFAGAIPGKMVHCLKTARTAHGGSRIFI